MSEIVNSFESLGVSAKLNDKLQELGITAPFEIQALAIADLIARRDVVGRAPTGSGKTLAFGIPIAMSVEKAQKRKPNALVLAPTRELADQIAKELKPLLEVRGLWVLAMFGGTGFDRQIRALNKGVDVLVATPGRLIDMLNQKELSLENVETVVVDEADRMSDMGFLPEVCKIIDKTSPSRQTVLFSATLGNEVQTLIDKYQDDPLYCEVGPESPDLTLMTHRFIKVNNENRLAVAAHFASGANSSIVFCRTKHGCNRLARQLQNAGLKTGLIHGDRSQSQRTTALRKFANGETSVLVATDVAARGIHIDEVDQVIHFDPPKEDSTYVHRSGRTARAGASGEVISLLKPNENRASKRMRRVLEIDVEPEEAPEINLDEFQEESRKRSLEERDEEAQRRKRSPKRGGSSSRSRQGGNSRGKSGGKSRGGSGQRRRKDSDDDRRGGDKRRSGGGRYKSRTSDGEGSSEGRSRRKPGQRNSKPGSGSKPKRRTGKPSGKRSGPGERGRNGKPAGKRSDSTQKSKRTGKPRPKNKNSRSKRAVNR